MAVFHGDKIGGGPAKGIAFKLKRKWTVIGFAVMAGGGLFLGLLLAVLLQEEFGTVRWLVRHSWLLIVLEFAALASTFVSIRQAEKKQHLIAETRVNWLKGGQAEELVAWYLSDLSDDWHIFQNVRIWKNGDLDHVLIGPSGLFCLSTKSHRGLYTVQGGTFLLNGEPTDDLKEAQKLAMELRDRLKGHVKNVPWVQPVLAVPLAYIGFETFQNTAWVVHEENLPGVFEDSKRNKLSKECVLDCVKAVEAIAAIFGK